MNKILIRAKQDPFYKQDGSCEKDKLWEDTVATKFICGNKIDLCEQDIIQTK